MKSLLHFELVRTPVLALVEGVLFPDLGLAFDLLVAAVILSLDNLL